MDEDSSEPPQARRHPRTIGALGAAALAVGGANRSLLLIGALLAAQGTAAIPLLAAGLLLSLAALPGWTELVLMWPDRVGGIAAGCAEAFRPYSRVLANLTGVCYWWGWLPACALTALLGAGILHAWYLPGVPVHLLAGAIVAVLAAVNLAGLRWTARLALPLAVIAGALAALSALIPLLSGGFVAARALHFHLATPFGGAFGAITGAMAGLYLVGSAAPGFEAALTHVGEMRRPERSVPRAVLATAGVSILYFLILPVVWLGALGSLPLQGDLSHALGPMFAPLLGGGARAAVVALLVLGLLSGTLQPMSGSARTLSQLAEDGLLPALWARRNRFDVPWVTTLLTAAMALLLLQSDDPKWVLAAANLAYLAGVGMPSVAVWLLRRNEPNRHRPYRAPRGAVVAGLVASAGWLTAAVLGFEQFGLPAVIASVALCYCGSALYVWRRARDHDAAGTRFRAFSLQGKLTAAMIAITALDGTAYLIAVTYVEHDNPALVALMQDVFVGISLLTIAVGLILPGIVGHAVEQVAHAARRLSSGTLAELTRAVRAIGEGHLEVTPISVPIIPVQIRAGDELGEMVGAFNRMQEEAGKAALALEAARAGLLDSKEALARQAGQQAAVAKLGLKALQLENPHEVRQEILEAARALLDADEVSIYEWVHAEGTVRRFAGVGGQASPLLGELAADDPLLRITTDSRLTVSDWEAEPATLSSVLRGPHTRATLAVWISEGEGASGILAANFRSPREFSRDESDTLQALANLLAGTSQRERAAEEVLWRALHDPLTGLPNRLLFVDRLRHAIAGCGRTGRSVAVLFLDIDHFKFVNDSLGHSAGDDLLRQIAERLREAMRAQDTVARFGGDEFVLICENLTSTGESAEIAERAIEVLSEPILLAGQEHVVTGSLGIAVAADPGRHPEDLIREADAAMYEAKERGRNGWAVYDEVMRARASRRLTVEHQLRRALEGDELRLSYQPVISLPERRIDGFEALLRWQHPERGLILPDEFMAVAEQSGLIVPIGRWVLREAVSQAARWHRADRGRRLPVAVNLSAREVTRRDLGELIAQLLREHALDPRLLELEITESILMDPAEASLDSLATLRERGVRIVLDDFGTGYSSLAYVKNFPIDGLKIDRSFVRDMAAASADASIVEAVIAMARGLRLGVVAEGVETSEQAELLEDMGCARCQGFAFARAMPAEEVERLLASEPPFAQRLVA